MTEDEREAEIFRQMDSDDVNVAWESSAINALRFLRRRLEEARAELRAAREVWSGIGSQLADAVAERNDYRDGFRAVEKEAVHWRQEARSLRQQVADVGAERDKLKTDLAACETAGIELVRKLHEATEVVKGGVARLDAPERDVRRPERRAKAAGRSRIPSPRPVRGVVRTQRAST